MPRHPKLLSKDDQPTKLGDAPEWHPFFLLTTIGVLLEAIFLFRHILSFLLGASCMIWVFACFILCFKSWSLAGHTYLGAPKLCHDLLELLSMLHLNFYEQWTFSSASLISFWAWCALVFLKKCYFSSLRFIWELVKMSRNSLSLHLKLFWEKEKLCSWSSLIFVWAYEKQHMKISPKVIDIQEG